MAHRKYGLRIAGFIFKGICTLAIIALIALLGWRIIDRKITPKQVSTILPNEKVCEAYLEDGKLDAFYQEQNEYTQGDNNYGYFANGGSLFIRDAKQLQFVLRYNNSTLKYTARDYELENEPSRDENVYDVTLVIMYDLTPENDDDNDGKTKDSVRYERIQPTKQPESHKKTLYNYRKYTFDGVVIDESVLAVYIDIYYVNDKDYSETSYGTLMLYNYLDENVQYKLTSNDKKALEEYNTAK